MKTKTNRNKLIKKVHSNRRLAFVRNGLNFFIEEADIDFYTAVCAKPYTKENWQKAMAFKNENERDFTHDERDCSGSSSVRIRVSRHKYSKAFRMHDAIVVKYHYSIDV